MRTWLLVPVAVLGVLAMHGLVDLGAPGMHAETERSMGSQHPTPAPQHSSSHLAAMSICTFALVAAAQQVSRGTSFRHSPSRRLSQHTGRLTAGPEPPVPRPVV